MQVPLIIIFVLFFRTMNITNSAYLLALRAEGGRIVISDW